MSNEPRILDAPALVSPSLLMVVEDLVAAKTIRQAAQADDIAVLEAGSVAEALATAQLVQPSLIILDRRGGDDDALDLFKKARGTEEGRANEIPIIVVADDEDALAWTKAGVTDWLIKPFSSAHARTRIRACLLRRACRWERALMTADEEQRLVALHDLGSLDTPPEERFDRITRLAAAIFNAPMALISLVDGERQWFKSKHGLDVAETSREASFCAHAISSRAALIVSDTFQDPRFADNPLVTHAPRIRFYAGFPIFMGANCIGTVCVLDDKPRKIDTEAVSFLRDLTALVEMELCRLQRMNE